MWLDTSSQLVECQPLASNNRSMEKKPKEINRRLARQIQKFRKAAEYTQEEFAEKLGISRTHMGHIEQNRKSPSLKLVDKIAKMLRVSVSDLFS